MPWRPSWSYTTTNYPKHPTLGCRFLKAQSKRRWKPWTWNYETPLLHANLFTIYNRLGIFLMGDCPIFSTVHLIGETRAQIITSKNYMRRFGWSGELNNPRFGKTSVGCLDVLQIFPIFVQNQNFGKHSILKSILILLTI